MSMMSNVNSDMCLQLPFPSLLFYKGFSSSITMRGSHSTGKHGASDLPGVPHGTDANAQNSLICI